MFSGIALDQGTVGFGLSFENYLLCCAGVGYSHFEAPLVKAKAIGAVNFRKLSRDFDMQPGILTCPWGLPVNASVPTNLWNNRLQNLPELFCFAGDVGCHRVSAFFNGTRPGMICLNQDVLVERLAQVNKYAAEAEITFCIELNDCLHLCSAAQILTRLGGDGSHIKLLIDVFHLNRCGLDRNWIDRLPHGSIGWVHICDVSEAAISERSEERCAPGSGSLDLRGFCQAINGRGYNGILSIEVLSEANRMTKPAELSRNLYVATQQLLETFKFP